MPLLRISGFLILTAALSWWPCLGPAGAATWKERGKEVFKRTADSLRPHQAAAEDLARAAAQSAKDWKEWKKRYEDTTKAMDDLVREGLPAVQDWLNKQWRNATDPREKDKYLEWLRKVRGFESSMVELNKSYGRILPAVRKAKGYIDLAGQIFDQHEKAHARRGGQAAYGLHMLSWLGQTFGDKVPLIGPALKTYSDAASALLDATDKLAADLVQYHNQGAIGPGSYGGTDNPQWRTLVAQFGEQVQGKGVFFPQGPHYVYGPDDDSSLRFIWDPQEQTWTKVPADVDEAKIYRQALITGRILSPQQLTVRVLNAAAGQRLEQQAEEIRRILDHIRDHFYTVNLLYGAGVPWPVVKYLRSPQDFSAHYVFTGNFKGQVRQAVKAVRERARRELARGQGDREGLAIIYRRCRELEKWGNSAGMELPATTSIVFQVTAERTGPIPAGRIDLLPSVGASGRRRVSFHKGWARLYVVPNGSYQVTARAQSFQPGVQALQVNDRVRPDINLKFILLPLAWRLAIQGPAKLLLGQRGTLTSEIKGAQELEPGAKLLVAWINPQTGKEVGTGPSLNLKREQGPGKFSIQAVLYQVKGGQRQALARASHSIEFLAPASLRFTALDRETRQPLPGARWDLKGPASFSRGPAAVIEIAPMPAGTYQVVVRAPGYHGLKGPLTLEAGGDYRKVAPLRKMEQTDGLRPAPAAKAKPAPSKVKPGGMSPQEICSCYERLYLKQNAARSAKDQVLVVSPMVWDPQNKKCTGLYRLPPPYTSVKKGVKGLAQWRVSRSLNRAQRECERAEKAAGKSAAPKKAPCKYTMLKSFQGLVAQSVLAGKNAPAQKEYSLALPGPGTVKITTTVSGRHQMANTEYGSKRFLSIVSWSSPDGAFKKGHMRGGEFYPGVRDVGSNTGYLKVAKAGGLRLKFKGESCYRSGKDYKGKPVCYQCCEAYGKYGLIMLPTKFKIKVEFQPVCEEKRP